MVASCFFRDVCFGLRLQTRVLVGEMTAFCLNPREKRERERERKKQSLLGKQMKQVS